MKPVFHQIVARFACPLLFIAACGAVTPAVLAAPPRIETVAGSGKPENNGDEGPALEINVGDPFGVEIGPDGALYIC
ncbi:MAG: hypothetical protein KDA55_08125, partial [Planctomycetales bacterium]|nr:hypothetical protein [Planctomycetales bacterium]